MNNPLKKHAHLFANGKFKAKAGIVGIINTFRSYNKCPAFRINGIIRQVKDCTLIARRIENMTHKEIINFDGSLINVDRRTALKVIEDTDRFEAWGMLNLLSIGVYPFDQSHFDDGTVIDSTTL